jgi:hypothetical protein
MKNESKSRSKLKLFLKTSPIITESYYYEEDGKIKLDLEKVRKQFEKEIIDTLELIEHVNNIK